MRKLQYNVMMGSVKFDTVDTLRQAQAYRDKGFRVIEVLKNIPKTIEEIEAEQKFELERIKRNKGHVNRKDLRFAATAPIHH